MTHEKFFNQVLPQIAGGVVQMKTEWSAHCICPGAGLHTTPTALNHTTAFWNGGKPWIYCHHTSCRDAVLAANAAFRSRCVSTGSGQSAVNVAAAVALDPHWELKAQVKVNKELILDRYRWPLAQIEQDSPYYVQEVPAIQTVLHLSLFEPNDVIWIGELNHTGKYWNRKNFRQRDNWLALVDKLSPFVCPAVFLPETYSRADRNVAARKYLVVESDTLTKDQVGAVFRLLAHRLMLRAVVDSGGKSLHGWFDCPDQIELEKLKAFLPELGCDPKMFGASQPCRLAGRRRGDGRLQRLVYLNPEISNEN